jgi:hypothetical protein
MTKQFEEGQIWRTRDGALVKITAVLPVTSWPIVASPYCPYDKTCNGLVKTTFTKDGYFFSREWRHGKDLVELVGPKDKEFAVGQIWRQRNGRYVKIFSIKIPGFTYPIAANFCDKAGNSSCTYTNPSNGRGYARDGRFFSWYDSEDDLVELVKPESAPAPSPQFKVGQVWESRDGEKFTITDIDDHPVYPIEADNGFCGLCFTSNGNYWDSCRASEHDLIKLISEPEPAPEPIASPPELQAFFNGEKPVYVVVADDRDVDPGEPIAMETSILPSNSFASFHKAVEGQKKLANHYGTTYIAECRIIPATRLDK